MILFDERDIDDPRLVTVERPSREFDDDGNYLETFETVVTGLAADIQYSLRVRTVVSEDTTGTSGSGIWIMYCHADADIRPEDRIRDDGRTFTVDAVGDWGTHLECVMRLV